MTREEDFDAFVARSGPSLLRTAVRLAGSRPAGEDLLQSALERTWSRWRTLTDTSAPVAEAYARRVLVTQAARERRRFWHGERATGQLPDRPVQAYDGLDEREALRRALADLPPRWRAVVVLRYVEDRPEAEVAELVGCSVGTVKSSASRGLARLREVPALRDLITPDQEGARHD